MNTPSLIRAAASVSACVALVAVSGCGATVTGAQERPRVTIENCGVEQTYERPDRAIAYDMSSIEKMFALGLADRMRGMVLPKTAIEPSERSPWAADYRRTPNLSTDVLSLETVVDAKADWVLAGWNAGFSEERGITPARLADLGIDSYQHTETCFNYGEDPEEPVPPLEAMYADLTTIGRVFGVEDKATQVVGDLRDRADRLAEQRMRQVGRLRSILLP